jgi:hypothetical protein
MIGFIGPSMTVTINDCLRLAPFLTGLRVSSLLRDWLGSRLRIGHFFSFRCPLVNTPQLNTEPEFWVLLRLNSEFSYDWILSSLTIESEWIHVWTRFYNLGRTEERPPPRRVRLLLSMFCPLLRNVPSDLLPSNGGPSTVDCVTSGIYVPNRCLAIVRFVTIFHLFVVHIKMLSESQII